MFQTEKGKALCSFRLQLAQAHQKLSFVLLLCFAALFFLTAKQSSGIPQGIFPGKSWEKISLPESVGWSSEKLEKAREYSRRIKTAGVMIIYKGKILKQWGETTRKFRCHSVRKSFLSALYGIYVHNGAIDLKKSMKDLIIDDNPPSLIKLEKTATVKMLLKARSGVYHPALYESPGMKASRPRRHSHAPGSFWYYNNWDFNALGTIFEMETGKKIFEDFKKSIADTIGMEDYEVTDGQYFRGPDSIHPAYPFRMSARDMARFGLLFLRKGKWHDKQIIPESWIKESTTSYSDAGQSGGYGYMWWIAVNGRHFPGMRTPKGTYSARGAGGHFIVVIPEFDLVVVHRVNTFIRGNMVSGFQFGYLLKLILDAKS